jgi:uncharacterized RDD family membrane protein YckC
MSCPLCGEICRCSTDMHSAAPPRWLPDDDACSAAATSHSEPQAPPPPNLPAVAKASDLIGSEESLPSEPAPEDPPAWRHEIADRLNRYQARRKPRPPRYPSLRLRFEEQDSAPTAASLSESPSFPQRVSTMSNRALALDGFAESVADVAAAPEFRQPELRQPEFRQSVLPETVGTQQAAAPVHPVIAPRAATTAKIIEFPRSWTPAPAPLDELAEPVMSRPRILEAPEVVPPPPALGGITIEPAQKPDLEKRPGIDIPLQSVALARRILSAAIDGVIIAGSAAIFGIIFWKVTAIRPPQFQILGLAAGLSGLFWAVYQYLLMVYSGTTPGLRLARLELTRFDGSPVSRRLRRWRVLASFLSAVSLGMGYVWVFLDEDSLCWHDRTTHTYLAPKAKP